MTSIDVTTETRTDAPVTHMTVVTQFIDAAEVRFAFRRFGAPGATPLVMLQHFRGNLDNWDSRAHRRTRSRARGDPRRLPGLGSSSGAFGPTIADTARRMIAFVTALDLSEVDLLGFSIGGFVAQEIDVDAPSAGAAPSPRRDWAQGRAGDARLARGHRGGSAPGAGARRRRRARPMSRRRRLGGERGCED